MDRKQLSERCDAITADIDAAIHYQEGIKALPDFAYLAALAMGEAVASGNAGACEEIAEAEHLFIDYLEGRTPTL